MSRNNVISWKVFSIVVTVLLILIIFVIGIQLFQIKNAYKLAYVNTAQLYESFEAKAELEKKLDNLINKQTTIVDSMESEIQKMYVKYEETKEENLGEKIFNKKRNIDRLKEEFNRITSEQKNTFMSQLWNQINEYVNDYGKENGYTIIFGATGSGNIMFANNGVDITQDLINYVNKRYEG